MGTERDDESNEYSTDLQDEKRLLVGEWKGFADRLNLLEKLLSYRAENRT